MTGIHPEPNPIIMLPFAAVLLAIALAPIVLRHHWEKHYPKLCIGLAAITSSYYIFALNSKSRVLHAGWEYLSFMVVVGGFFVVAGGIHLRVGGPGRPAFNTLFLLAGALLGNVIGTVGASMLLIRPWIAINRNRFAGLHVAFFIFAVSNIGGVLLPIGPPLLLGYLKGVPFWWGLQRSWQPWGVTLVAVLIIFYLLDRLNYRAAAHKQHDGKTVLPGENWRCDGRIKRAIIARHVANVRFQTMCGT